ncbi:glycosyltransferase family 4 protein [uncultured Paracoccus sp.]|uniref:glycosyltransferase family 4 protein n=1 Tax=uncultured Paracoccus sp. TaxID=189685 RepID=UPI00260765E4|nr:glycosyltransferase family 4 protein [uncultured Paracoccus sp.]
MIMRDIATDPVPAVTAPPGRWRLSVAFVSQYFFPEQFSNNAIVEDLVQRGHDVTVITGIPNYGRETFFDGYSNRERRDEIWRGANVHRARSVARGKRKLQLLLNYLTFPVTGSWTALRKMRNRPDVIFASLLSPVFQALPAIILAWRHRVPLVYWVQDIWPESATHTLNLKTPLIVCPLGFISGWIMRRADLVLVQSAAFPPMITRFGVPAERIRVLPNTAPAMYRPLTPDQATDCGIPPAPGQFTVMFAGNIGESQNFDTILATAEALRERADLRWVILGNGRDFDRVKARVAELGLGDQFLLLGRHPEEIMPDFFAHADALLVSLKENDIFNLTVPYKVQCYMACGKPVLAALAGEGARVVTLSGGGVAVAPGNVEALKSAVLSLMVMQPEARAEMGRAARAFYDANYRRDVVYDQLDSWLTEAAHAGRKGPPINAAS